MELSIAPSISLLWVVWKRCKK